MYLFEIKNGKANEITCGTPTIFITEEEASRLLKDTTLMLAVEKHVSEDSLFCVLGDQIDDNTYSVENTIKLDLDELIKTQGEYGFYEHISEKW